MVASDGKLHKVDCATMASVWQYAASSPATTMAKLSLSRGVLVFGTADLAVHAVHTANGSVAWRTNPTGQEAATGNPFSYEFTWPVIADSAGVVFMRYRLWTQRDWLWGPGSKYPLNSTDNRYPSTNANIRAYLQSKPAIQALFALHLSNGTTSFIPAVGNGGVDCYFPDNSTLVSTVGPVPVVKTLASGHQVAYSTWRNGQVAQSSYDGRWDSHMGEMLLDAHTVPGYSAGDLRFVDFPGSYVRITDEASPISMANNTLFHAHWGGSESCTVLDRSDSKGHSFAAPITVSPNPPVARRVQPQGSKNTTSRWVQGSTNWFDDTRGYYTPQWWVYWNEWDPPRDFQVKGDYSDGTYQMRPRYTFVSDGSVYVVGNGGDVFALSTAAYEQR